MKQHFWALFGVILLAACIRNLILIQMNMRYIQDKPEAPLIIGTCLFLGILSALHLIGYTAPIIKKFNIFK